MKGRSLRRSASYILMLQCASLGLSWASNAAAIDPAAPAVAAPAAGSPIAAASAPSRSTLSFVRRVLPNGVTLIVAPNYLSNVVGMEVVSRVGTSYEAPARAGLAALTLRVAESGTADESGDTIQQWFEDRGAALQSRVHPDYSEIGAATVATDFPRTAAIMSSLTAHATLSLQAFSSQKKALQAEMTSVDRDEEAATYQSLRTLLADGTAYGRPDNGVSATVMSLTLEDVDRFYHLMFAPREIVVTVSGHVDTDSAMALLERLFGGIRDQGAPGRPETIHTFIQEPESMVLAGEGEAAWIMVGFLTPGVRDSDYAAAYVLNAIIGGANSGRLTTLFRDRRGVYDSGSFLQPFASQTHIVGYVRADPLLWDQQQQKLKPTVNELEKDLRGVFQSIHDQGVTEDQVRNARNYVLGEYLRSHEHNRDYAGYLGWYEAIGLGAGFDEQLIHEIRQVTPEQVNRLAHSYLQAPLGATVVMLPRPRAEG